MLSDTSDKFRPCASKKKKKNSNLDMGQTQQGAMRRTMHLDKERTSAQAPPPLLQRRDSAGCNEAKTGRRGRKD